MFTTRNLIILIGRHTLIILVAISIAATACIVLVREITKVADDIIQSRRLASSLEKRIELFSTIAHDAEIIGKSDKQIEGAFPPSDSIFEFISILESIALKNTVTQSFRFEDPILSPFTSPLPLSTIGYSNNLSLNVFTLIKYLKDFEGLPYFTKINNLTISSQDALGWRGASRASFNAVLYAKTAQ